MNLSQELFQRYAERGDEDAFRELVANYFSLVRSTALRRLQGNSSLADDVVQLVFTDFAKKAPRLPKDLFLGGWLHQHTCFVAAKTIRTEMRRTRREREAADMKTLESTEAHLLSPVLDEAIHELPNDDRSALILRFVEGRDLKTVGEALNVSEDAAQKRVHRAVERLRALLTSKGFTTSTAALTAVLTSADAAASTSTVDRVAATALGNTQRHINPGSIPKVLRLRVAIPLLMVGLVSLIWWKSSFQDRQRAGGPGPDLVPASSPQAGTADQTSHATDTSVSPTDQAIDVADAARSERQILKVHVVDDSTGSPIFGASVRHMLSQNEQSSAADPVYLTDEKGIASVNLPGRQMRRFQITAFHPNYSGWISVWDLNNGEAVPAEHEIRLTPGVPIGGTVLDPAGAPLRDVAVRVYRFWSGSDPIDRSNQRLNISTVTNRTGSDGRWSVSHVPQNLLENIGLKFAHPDYAETNKSVDDESLPLLRSGTFTVTLAKGMNLFGYVRQTNSDPVVGAKVSFGKPNFQNQRETATDENGRYEFKNLFRYQFNETEPVTVLAEGYAPAVRHMEPQADTQQVDFVVEAGNTLRGRVLNEDGEPIAGVRVSRENSQFDAQNEAGIEWSTQTDKEGRFQWAGAPATPQSFYFGHGSYAQVRGKKLSPSEEEHVIVLKRKRFVQGTVRNLHNGEFLREFRVLPANGTPESLSSWSESDEKVFKDGFFQLELSEEEHNVVRIRADGYQMANYRIPPDGAELQANLKPSAALSGVVYDLEGRTVPGVEVAAVGSAGPKYLAIAKGKFSRSQREVDRTETDTTGRFVIQPSVAVDTLVAVSAIGYAELRLAEPGRDYALTLQPWGRVEGIALQGDQPLAGATLTLGLRPLETKNLLLDYSSYKCETGPQGEFAFDMVPPRAVQLSRQIPIGPRTWTSANQTNVLIHPGQTSRLELKIDPGPASAP